MNDYDITTELLDALYAGSKHSKFDELLKILDLRMKLRAAGGDIQPPNKYEDMSDADILEELREVLRRTEREDEQSK